MKNKVFFVLVTFAIVAVLTSCGKVPQAEIESTNAAIAAAQAAEADVYLADEFAVLQDSMNAINAAVEIQKGKLFKNFGTVKEDLASVVAQANELAANVDAKKEEVKNEAEILLNDIKPVITENNRLSGRLPRGKEGATAIEAIKADIASVESAVTDAQNLYDQGSYMEAFNTVSTAKEKAESVNAEMKEVLTKARIRF